MIWIAIPWCIAAILAIVLVLSLLELRSKQRLIAAAESELEEALRVVRELRNKVLTRVRSGRRAN